MKTRFTTDSHDSTVASTGQEYHVDALTHRAGTVDVAAFTPVGRPEHVRVSVHSVDSVTLDTYVNGDDIALTLELRGEVHTSVTLWGLTLDDLQAALDAAKASV